MIDETKIQQELTAKGFSIPTNLNDYGKFIRFGRKQASWLIHNGDHVVFGDFRTNEKHVIKPDDTESEIDQEKIEKIREQIRKREQKEKELRKKTKRQIKRKFERLPVSPTNHSYFIKKGINTILSSFAEANEIKIEGNTLWVPVYHSPKKYIASMQYISPDGMKLFQKHCSTRDGYFVINQDSNIIYLCEGVATAFTLAYQTGCTVYCAFSCHNMLNVAIMIHNSHDLSLLVVAADNDDAGVKGAKDAAIMSDTLRSKYIIPEEEGDDFNDEWIKKSRQQNKE